MKKRASTFLGLFLLVIVGAGSGQDQAQSSIVFGVLAFDGEAEARDRWDTTIDILSAKIPDWTFELAPLTLDGARNALQARELHFLLTNPGQFHSLMLKHELAPLVSLRTDAPGHIKTENRYGAVIFARASEHGPKVLADLKGLKFGAVAPDAFGGWQLALHTLRTNGLVPERDFEELRFFGFPQSSIVHAVLDGEVDAGTVRTGVLEAMMAAGKLPQGSLVVLNSLKVPSFDLQLSTALTPEWLIAATPMASPDLRSAVARVLLDIEPSDTHPTGWQPPQSIAPVVEIRSALVGADGSSTMFGLPQLILFVVVTMLSLSVIILVVRRHVAPVRSLDKGAGADAFAPQERALNVSLTTREEQVLGLVESGQTTKEIARALSISPKTVEFHRHNLMQKFAASNMADLVHRSALWRQRT